MKFGVFRGEGESHVIVRNQTNAALLVGYRDVEDVLIASQERRTADVQTALRVGAHVELDQVRWLPPLRRPGKILGVSLNDRRKSDKIISGPSTPAMFFKPASSLVGHREPIRLREEYGRVHAERELAVVIGVGGSDITAEDALSHVFGYTIINDLTSPTLREMDTFHFRASQPDADGARYTESWTNHSARYKGADTFGPLGPWVVTADEIPHPDALRISCRHNGVSLVDTSTADLRFGVAEVISFASRYFTLEPGDVIAMGTASGRPTQRGGSLQVDLARSGGTIEVEIEGIGVLSNPVERRD